MSCCIRNGNAEFARIEPGLFLSQLLRCRVACDSLALNLEDPGLVMPARRIADRKLPNKRRTVFSEGRIAALVQLSAVGGRPWSWTNSRRATTASSTRESATSGSGTASPSNTPRGFVLWELRSTKFQTLSRHETGQRRVSSLSASCICLAEIVRESGRASAKTLPTPGVLRSTTRLPP